MCNSDSGNLPTCLCASATGGGGWLLKLSTNGDSLWSVFYGDTADAVLEGIQETADGGFILVGSILSADSNKDFYLVKTDANGTAEWIKTFGGTNKDEATAVIQASDLGFTLIGIGDPNSSENWGTWVIHMDANGDTLWTLLVGGPGFQIGLDLVEIGAGEYFIAGLTIDDLETGQFDGWMVWLGTGVISVDENLSEIPSQYALKQNYPNPFNPVTTIRYDLPLSGDVTLKVYNLLSEEVVTLVQGQKNAGRYIVTWDATHVASGIYFYKLQVGDDLVQTKKMLLIR